MEYLITKNFTDDLVVNMTITIFEVQREHF